MTEYLVSVMLDEEYPTVKELAEQIANDYGVVTYHGTPHYGFVRAILDSDLAEKKEARMMLNSSPRVYVYKNSKVLFDFIEEILPELENEKALSIGVKDSQSLGVTKFWRVYWKDTLRVYKKRPLGIEHMRCYQKGHLENCRTSIGLCKQKNDDKNGKIA